MFPLMSLSCFAFPPVADIDRLPPVTQPEARSAAIQERISGNEREKAAIGEHLSTLQEHITTLREKAEAVQNFQQSQALLAEQEDAYTEYISRLTKYKDSAKRLVLSLLITSLVALSTLALRAYFQRGDVFEYMGWLMLMAGICAHFAWETRQLKSRA